MIQKSINDFGRANKLNSLEIVNKQLIILIG